MLIMSSQLFSQVKFGLTAGGNVCNMKFNIESKYGVEPDTKAKMGYQIGVITDFTLAKKALSLQPALLFSNKGYSLNFEKMLADEFNEYNVTIDNYQGNVRLSYNYIELPVNLVYKTHGFQFSAGPYIAFGINGKMKHNFSFEADGDFYTGKDVFGNGANKLVPVYGPVDNKMVNDYLLYDDVYDYYRGFDYGLNIGFGYQLKGILFRMVYSFGLANLTPNFELSSYEVPDNYTQDFVQKNRVLTFSVSYFFN